MQNNDELISNILNELDEKKKAPKTAPPSAEETAPDESATTEFRPLGDNSEAQAPAAEETPVYEQPVQPQRMPAGRQYPPRNMNPYGENVQGGMDPRFNEGVQPPRKKKKKKKKKRSRVPGVLILTTFIFAISIVLSMIIIGFGKDMLGIGKSEETKLVIIEKGSTTEEIAEMLKDEGIIRSPKFFILFSRLRKADSLYIPGEHFIRANMAYETIIQNLTTDEEENKETVEITFPEGINIIEAAQILEENGVCSREDFLFNFNSGGYGFAFEDMLPINSVLKFQKMEGYVFPDTYFFYKEMDPIKVCQKIYLNFQNKMTPERLKKMEQLDLSLDQLITFSSIVQKEARNSEDMKKIASVFWNRLRNKDEFPRLESDPTKNYAEKVINKNMQIYDKTIVDAYNTYEGVGLPPGAICNPGLEAIDAVLENYQSNYFFFIANIYTGETFFSETLEEHNIRYEEIKQAEAEYEAASEAAALEAQQNGES